MAKLSKISENLSEISGEISGEIKFAPEVTKAQ
jgi:hypothetical protein